MGSKTRYRRFEKAFTTWLRACEDLVTLVSASKYILITDGTMKPALPSAPTILTHLGPLLEDVDGIYVTRALCETFAATPGVTLEMIGAIEEHVKQSQATLVDAKFESDDIRTIGIRSLGVRKAGEKTAPDSRVEVYVSSVEVEIRWIDTAS